MSSGSVLLMTVFDLIYQYISSTIIPYLQAHINKIDRSSLKFISLHQQYRMSKKQIEDLSAIIQKKSCEESQMTFEQSKPRANILCPTLNNENYACIICNRLRRVCPSTKLKLCHQQLHQKGVYKSDYFMEKSNISTLPGQRMRTQSMNDAYKLTDISRSRQQKQLIQSNLIRPAPLQSQVHLYPAEQVIFYPVIHNKFVPSPAVEKSRLINTPNRSSKSRRVEANQEEIMTPSQIKQLLFSYKQ